MTSELKTQINEKKTTFSSVDKEEPRRVEKELKMEIKKGKDSYRRKLEEHLQLN